MNRRSFEGRNESFERAQVDLGARREAFEQRRERMMERRNALREEMTGRREAGRDVDGLRDEVDASSAEVVLSKQMDELSRSYDGCTAP